MTMYYIGVSKTFNNVSKRNNPFSKSKPVSMAFYVSESLSVRSKRVIPLHIFYTNTSNHVLKEERRGVRLAKTSLRLFARMTKS